MTVDALIAFLLMTTAMSFVPGPSVMFVAAQGAWRGCRAGLAAVLGVQTGVFCYFMLTAVGLTPIIATSNLVFTIVKWLGVAYLIWLGVQALRASFSEPGEHSEAVTPSARGFRDGFVVALSNPKAVLYFLALLPQFIDPSRPVAIQVLQLGAIAMSIDFLAQSLYAFSGAALSSRLTQPRIKKWSERTIGTVFLLLAGFAATVRRAV